MLRKILKRAELQLDDPKLMADAVVAAFFNGAKPREREELRADVQAAVEMGHWREPLALLRADLPLTPFHWPLEFPEVFDRPNGGCDAIVGNPPFLGGKRISSHFGNAYKNWLVALHCSTSSNADLVVHFLRRAFHLLCQGGALGLIATNTIRQGDSRASGLGPIRSAGGVIYQAKRRLKWPGDAAVVITTVHVHKGPLAGPYVLNDRPVDMITAFLFHGGEDVDPANLAANEGKSFVGSFVLGIGFTFDDQNVDKGSTPTAEIRRLIEHDRRNAERIFPYIGGEELNSSPSHARHRYVINFDEMTEEEARCWPDLFELLYEKVRPQRLSKDAEKYPRIVHEWWKFWRNRPLLTSALQNLEYVLAIGSSALSHVAFARLRTGSIFPHKLIILTDDNLGFAATLQSRVHQTWTHFFGTTFGSSDAPTYNPTQVFETFPFPEKFESDPVLETVGEAYYAFRAELMVARDKGLTKTYNDFHDRRLRSDPEIQRLRELHHAMDQAVLRAYGWDDLTESAAPIFLDETNEDEFAYQGRLFWPSDFRDEVLARLLALNAERRADEVRRGVASRRGSRAQATDDDAGPTADGERDAEGEAA